MRRAYEGGCIVPKALTEAVAWHPINLRYLAVIAYCSR
jgi:hypothetical protein